MGQVAGEFADFTLDRAVCGDVISVFSSRNGKQVEHVRDEHGDFVRRFYYREAVRDVEAAGVTFQEGWKAFNQMFENAGIEIVQSALIEGSVRLNPLIVAKYVGGIGKEKSVKSLESDKKIELVGNIGKLLTSHERFVPDPQGYLPDAFAIDPDNNNPVLIDIDPYLKPRERGFGDRLDMKFL